MKFSHLVQINDPLNPLIDPLSREQLWRGLVYRAENPLPFVLGLDQCRIVARSERTLRRELHFGSLTVRDRVTLDPMNEVRYETEAGGGLPASSLVMTIEEPGGGTLSVRFEYETLRRTGDAPSDEFYNAFLRKAYVEADIDTVRTIRRLVVENLL
jgi:acetylaranotin biosynthesis cluster protein L